MAPAARPLFNCREGEGVASQGRARETSRSGGVRGAGIRIGGAILYAPPRSLRDLRSPRRIIAGRFVRGSLPPPAHDSSRPEANDAARTSQKVGLSVSQSVEGFRPRTKRGRDLRSRLSCGPAM